MDLFIYHRTPHTSLVTAKIFSKVSDINTKLIKTQSSLQEFLQRNTPHVEIHYKTLEKLLRFEQNISEYNLFQLHLFTEDSNVEIHLSKNSFTQTIYTTTNFVHTSSVEEKTQSGIPDCYLRF